VIRADRRDITFCFYWGLIDELPPGTWQALLTPLWITWDKACLMPQTSIWFDRARKWQQASRRQLGFA
jgi:hypothetical protein